MRKCCRVQSHRLPRMVDSIVTIWPHADNATGLRFTPLRRAMRTARRHASESHLRIVVPLHPLQHLASFGQCVAVAHRLTIATCSGVSDFPSLGPPIGRPAANRAPVFDPMPRAQHCPRGQFRGVHETLGAHYLPIPRNEWWTGPAVTPVSPSLAGIAFDILPAACACGLNGFHCAPRTSLASKARAARMPYRVGKYHTAGPY